MLVGSLEWRGGRVRAGVTHKVTGERRVDPANAWRLPRHGTTDLWVDATWETRHGGPTVRVRATVNNLFDTDYLAGVAGAGAWIGAPDRFGPARGSGAVAGEGRRASVDKEVVGAAGFEPATSAM